jgi:hypothetical protein
MNKSKKIEIVQVVYKKSFMNSLLQKLILIIYTLSILRFMPFYNILKDKMFK